MADNVVLLEPGDERAQKIAKAMSSQMASDILQLLAESPQSLTGITERLAIPLTTAKYHTENLLDAGLIQVLETKYSVKGREIKIYSLTNQLLIVAPRQSNVHSLLLKYASLFGIVIFGSLVIAMLSPILGTGSTMGSSLNGEPSMAAREYGGPAAKAAAEGGLQNATMVPDSMVAGSKGVVDTVVCEPFTGTITICHHCCNPPCHSRADNSQYCCLCQCVDPGYGTCIFPRRCDGDRGTHLL